MPPRFAFWTILIDGKPTAFRARDAQELLPTCNQLKRTSKDVVMRWFARGRLWESPEAERDANRRPKPPIEKRSRDWRPGGSHQDPRDRFKKKNRPERAWSPSDTPVRRDRDKLSPPSEARPGREKPSGPPRGDRPWQTKPSGPRADRKPWRDKPFGGAQGRPFGGAHGRSFKPAAGAHGKPAGPGGPRKPWAGKPGGPPRGDRKPWHAKPKPSGGWRDRPPIGGQRKPWHGKARENEPRKQPDESSDKSPSSAPVVTKPKLPER